MFVRILSEIDVPFAAAGRIAFCTCSQKPILISVGNGICGVCPRVYKMYWWFLPTSVVQEGLSAAVQPKLCWPYARWFLSTWACPRLRSRSITNTFTSQSPVSSSRSLKRVLPSIPFNLNLTLRVIDSYQALNHETHCTVNFQKALFCVRCALHSSWLIFFKIISFGTESSCAF